MIEYIEQDFVRGILKPRPKDVHKGGCGHVLVVAGSKGMVGAALLTAMGALRSGAGLVKVSIDEEYFPIVHGALPEVICVDRRISLQELNSFNSIAVGPGLGLESKSKDLLEMVLSTEKPVIIVDADGLSLLNFIGEKNIKKSSAAEAERLIITPHPGEAARLLGMTAEEINSDRISSGKTLNKKYKAISVLKGHETLITDFRQNEYLNTSGNPGMATAGSGDVLAGIIAGFGAQGYTPLEASILGVYIHGVAGDIGAEFLGEFGMIASDIASMTGLAIKKVMTHKKENENE